MVASIGMRGYTPTVKKPSVTKPSPPKVVKTAAQIAEEKQKKYEKSEKRKDKKAGGRGMRRNNATIKKGFKSWGK